MMNDYSTGSEQGGRRFPISQVAHGSRYLLICCQKEGSSHERDFLAGAVLGSRIAIFCFTPQETAVISRTIRLYSNSIAVLQIAILYPQILSPWCNCCMCSCSTVYVCSLCALCVQFVSVCVMCDVCVQ
jgi:hypothetical protein